MTSQERTLYVCDRPDLGHPLGPNGFVLHLEFLRQLHMMFDGLTAHRPYVIAETAERLAQFIESKKDHMGWRIHQAVWGDEDGKVVAQFVQFLRGGEFLVVLLARSDDAN